MGIIAYLNGTEVGTDSVKQNLGSKISGDGHVVIGRWALGGSLLTWYASAYVDELKMYNSQLS